jgi:Uma2 family endonuclease
MNSLVIDKPKIQKSSDIEYPTSDGKPMAETEVHIMAILNLINALRHFFRKQDIYVIGNMYLYYQQGNTKAHKAPDVMVVKNVGKHTRRSFKVWEEKAMPCVVFEITSQETKREDTINKPLLYASLGIKEYFLFDPLDEYLEQQFLGYRLVDGKYALLSANEDGEIFSTELQAVLRPEGRFLRIVEPQTGLSVPNLDEAVDMAIQEMQRAEQEAQRAEQEAQRATIAEEEIMQLRAEMAELRKQLASSGK